MKQVAVMVMVTLFLLSRFCYADGTIKLGYVDMRSSLNESKAGKEAKKKLEKIIADKQVVLDEERKKLDEVQKDFERKAALLSEKAKEEKQKEFQEKVRKYQKMLADAQQEINELESQYTKEIIEKIKKIIQDIAKEEGYTLIFEKTEISVLFAKEGLDLTDKVIEKFNALSR